jgi:putative transposase
MPYREQQFSNGEIYHIVTRGIDDNLLFKDINDYYRGIFSIYEFNNSNPVEITRRRQEIKKFKKSKTEGGPASSILETSGGRASASFDSLQPQPKSLVKDKRDLMVDILCFSFMPNHLHLLIRQTKDSGITKFMSKLGTGYASYFNKKYERKGYVFQNRFVSVPIKSNEQLMTVFVYIHANPISLIEPKWKEIEIKNPDEVIRFLENKYRWSSYFDYIGKQNFPSVINKEFMLNVMGGEQSCKKFVEDWVRFKADMREYSDLALE